MRCDKCNKDTEFLVLVEVVQTWGIDLKISGYGNKLKYCSTCFKKELNDTE